MDALSGIKMMVPDGLPSALPNASPAGTPNPISLSELQGLTPGTAAPSSGVGKADGNFENMLGNFVGEVSQSQTAANDSVNGLLSGKNVSLHQAMISMEEANVSFQLMVEVRNRLLDSYQELMRMQV
jgi:flagellar hook-basal body complex protein FliE